MVVDSPQRDWLVLEERGDCIEINFIAQTIYLVDGHARGPHYNVD